LNQSVLQAFLFLVCLLLPSKSKIMAGKIYYLFVIAFSGLLSAGYAQLPDLDLKNLDQQYVNLQEIQGESLTIVDFWATWCKPCVASIPKINQLAEEFKTQGVAFWGINVDSPRNLSKVKPFVTSLNIRYPVFLDTDQKLMNSLNVSIMPTLLILDKAGKIRFFHEGFQPGDEKVISEEIKKLLKKT
jgi:cytochrome c biogenesis protein CcmG, thiol:disulfide interchange protein DsbE